ncbi:GNAT family N-acetyltransferase [Nocardia sp. NPDC059154]|uniref:GNAT family N-acetyltransferase n=1 Tax=Nocardia sp. NPDC059154 TaxID=3346744 RepID=UPI0036A94908
MIEVVTVSTEQELADAYAVRMKVFVDEQGVPADIEIDELDETADHFLARLDGRPAGADKEGTSPPPSTQPTSKNCPPFPPTTEHDAPPGPGG